MAAKHRLLALRLFAGSFITGVAICLTGCANFFVCEGKTSCPSTGTGTGTSTTENYAYVSNSASGTTYINAYSLASGTLSAISGFPANLTFTPNALVVSPSNSFLYASSTTGNIFAYSIGSGTGSLNTINSGNAVATSATGVWSMDMSADGNYLFALDLTGSILYEYQVNTTTGLLTFGSSFPIVSAQGVITPESVKVSPNNDFVVCSLGTAGDVVFPYSSSSGITTTSYASIPTGSNSVGDYGLAVDTSDHIYVARTSGVAVYAVTFSASTMTVSSVPQSNLTIGAGPHSVALGSASGGTVYVGNQTDGTISAYTNTSGTLSNLSGSPFAAPFAVNGLARDSSGKYLMALGLDGTAGIQLYTIGSTGALTAGNAAASGTAAGTPTVIAMTH